MKKEEFIKRYGTEAYEKELQRARVWWEAHPGENCQSSREWRETHLEEAREKDRLRRLNHPEKVKATNHETSRKGGRYYEKRRTYDMKGIPHERNLVRGKHNRRWRPYKQIIAPESQIHHEWIPDSADFRGVALVEKYQHQHGIIDAIQILEGKITLLTEAEIVEVRYCENLI
jgi:hypothetical protein